MINCLNKFQGNITVITREDPLLVKKWLDYYQINFVNEVLQSGIERTNISFYNRETILIDDSLRHCISAKKAGAYVIGVCDHHSNQRQMEMRNICDEYLED